MGGDVTTSACSHFQRTARAHRSMADIISGDMS
eukprot:CAMPEP_0174373002 /NCGR_PEP_ID=MMETSP0811_2-20130205/105457_1 /TAXON_ID=73025 ORGANISM="Eutreptiella gymnastica-like, Strain CCMP1594" /NCGR_SAMPLE_ID=MMETSP0811_2 /ASSEMBLY_ACC=CAM_ASM_000667 /LENGTH=32 /DNA_ID= /DNA_START= /DNA_END= /DNA_ORIENTATION=